MGQTHSKVYNRESASNDGLIYSAVSGDLGLAATRYIYIDLTRLGYKHFSLEHIITATTITLEACNNQFEDGRNLFGTATATDGTGATLTDLTLNTVQGFVTDTELNGIKIRILRDNTTPSNIGLTRIVTGYTAATGTLALDTPLGPTTSGITEYRLEDNPTAFRRIVDDPPYSQWIDVTDLLFGMVSATTSGFWLGDTDIVIERLRVKAVTTNAINALNLRLSRAR